MALASAEYPFLNLMWTMLVFFCWIAWFWLLFVAFGDLFRRADLSGWAKAGWTVLLIVLPFLGVLLYLITQGRHIVERQRAREAGRYVSTSDRAGAAQIAEARRLLEEGVIDDAEYQALKRKALAR
ncbi:MULTISPECIES: SHOCT domain-containing protein [unclassified Amycolatopsis]|uniref:SHOCT domain-containing protein n=1 Tax=unclassified Amycolatopsis TaxID=2618356 RepID=UPI002876BB7E|nr:MULTISPECIES: SHOCT domain-containing protein [unclassified Amycolatopsis]MDS0140349.1 PLDc N-terminal domain-containing protein [Amycolatopsis sp. 505]MDS0149047.1 PLDc N-terminal domain-containing protein [Amycolatopsis sp. CM201R]